MSKEKRAIKELGDGLEGILSSSYGLEDKLAKITDVYMAAIQPWNLAGDDGTLSRMRNLASTFVTKAIVLETKPSDHGLPDESRLNSIRGLADSISWLPEGFKSFIRAEIAFRIAALNASASAERKYENGKGF